MTSEINFKVRVNDRQLPTPDQQNIWIGARADRYGSPIVQPLDRKALSLEGSYYYAHNAINDAATTLAGHAAPVLADADATLTKPFLFVRMPDSATKFAFLDFVEIEVVTAGANGTQACWAAQTDSGTTRVTTPGTDLTRLNANQRSSNTPDLAVQGGVITVGAETVACRVVGFGTLRPSIEIAGDKKIFVFGGDPASVGAQSDAAATAIRTSTVALPPLVLGPSDSFMLALHGQASQNAAGVYKIRLGWAER